MCDYSLMGIPNRLARDGEELVLYRFPSNTKGFASPADVNCCNTAPQKTGFWEGLKKLFRSSYLEAVPAVCIAPGARLELKGIPKDLQHCLNVNAVEQVTFSQLTAATNVHRDAVRFGNGIEVSLQRLAEGQRAKVLSLDLDMDQIPTRPTEFTLHLR
jgi:hypothetical protein